MVALHIKSIGGVFLKFHTNTKMIIILLISLIIVCINSTHLEDITNNLIPTASCGEQILMKSHAHEVLSFYLKKDDCPVNVIINEIPVILVNFDLNFKIKKYMEVDFYLAVLKSSYIFERLIKQIYKKFRPETKFIIIYTGTEDLASIFRMCFRYRILNIILIYQDSIYTYSPYDNGECGTHYVPKLLGRCGNLTDVHSLFVSKIPHVVPGCEMRILTITVPPYVIDVHSDRNPGLEVEIIREISQRTNTTLRYIPHTENNFGRRLPDGSYTGMYATLLHGEADLMFGMVRMNYSFILDFSYTAGHAMDHITWHVPSAYELDKRNNISMIFSMELWNLLGLAVLINSIAWWFLSRKLDNYRDLSLCMCYTIYTLLQGSIQKPLSHPLRLLFIVWVVSSLLLATAYQSKLISLLTRTIYAEQIKETSEILSHGLKYGFYETIRELFNEPDDPVHMAIYNGYTHCPFSNLDCIDRAAFRRDFAVLKNRRMITYLTPRYLFPNGRKRLYSFEKDLFYYPLIMIAVKGYPLLPRINFLILCLHENGVINKLDKDLTGYKEPPNEDSLKLLSVSHLKGAFLLYIIGNITAALVLAIENVIKYIYSHKLLQKCCLKFK